MTTKKPNPKTTAKKPVAKKSLPKVEKIEIDVPTTDEVKDLVADTWKAIQADNFKLTEKTKKGVLARIKSWFKVS
jgi:nicotinate-nucleotide pyrophosphorylase